MNKSELIQQLSDEHRHILERVQHFDKKDFERPGATGEWTAKDVFSHLAFWNWEAAKSIEQVARNERPVMMLDVNFDEINAREATASHDQPLHKVMDGFRRSQKTLIAQIEGTASHELTKETPFKSGDNKNANAAWIVGGIIEHYQEHREALNAFANSQIPNPKPQAAA